MNKKQIRWCCLLFMLFTIPSFIVEATNLSGKITDENGEPLPFANLYIKNTSIGTASNAEGKYSLELSPGEYEIVYQFIGFKREERKVTVGEERLVINVSLSPEIIQLREVIVNANAEDPAFEIIRQAINKRKFYQNEIASYDCDVYIKGLQRLDDRPDKILGFNVTVDTGIVYLSESVSKFSYSRPGKIKEEMISSKVSGQSNAFSFNQASEMTFSFYDNILVVEGLSERGFISPIANNALFFYDYELIGTFEEGEQLVNKIKVIPKRNHDPVFSGFIYILENSWRIHTVDLMLTKANQIEFVDSVRVNQVFTQVDEVHWMILSQKFEFQFKVFGFLGSGYFISINSNYVINEVHPKKYFTYEILSVVEGANKRDSIYWQKIRPIPLTIPEAHDYFEKDSLAVIKESKAYKDSIDHISNKVNPAAIILTGYTYSNSFKDFSLGINPLLNMLQFNTVEGWVLNANISYQKSFEDRRFFRINPEVRYGFSSEELYAQLSLLYYLNPRNQTSIGFQAGRFYRQINGDNPISPFMNSWFTLFERENYMKIYQSSHVRFNFRKEIVNGIRLTSALEYEDRTPLINTTDFSIVDKDDKAYTPNHPDNLEIMDTSFPQHQAFTWELIMRIRFAQKYISRPDRKINLGSKFPVLSFKYKKAFKNVLGGDVKYDLLQLNISDDFDFGLVGTGNFSMEFGSFLSGDSLSIIDFKHFQGNQTYMSSFQTGGFELLDYYFYSTQNNFLQLHYAHHFNGFIVNKLPLLRKTKTQLVGSLNYLKSTEVNNYLELGVGLEHIFKVLRVDYFVGFLSGNKLQNGFRFGVGF